MLMKTIHATWLREEITTVLLLNIMRAFDNLSHMRLIHNLRKRRIDDNMINWILSFLSNCSMIISLSKFISKIFETDTGISQESLISSLFYLFYNADLMKKEKNYKTINLRYIDDVAKIITESSTEINCRKIESLFKTRKQSWSQKHASKFASTKFQLLHFKRSIKTSSSSEDDTLHLKEHTIESRDIEIYLEVLLNKKLRWFPHLRRVEKRVSQALNAFNNLRRSTWRASALNLRRIYQICIVLKALYACSLWYSSERDFGKVKLENAVIKTLISVQRRATRVIAEIFRNISGSALNVKLYLLPVKQMLEKTLEKILIRLRTSQVYDQIAETRQHFRVTEDNFRYWSPLRKLKERYDA